VFKLLNDSSSDKCSLLFLHSFDFSILHTNINLPNLEVRMKVVMNKVLDRMWEVPFVLNFCGFRS
jgi:hypothetical protein